MKICASVKDFRDFFSSFINIPLLKTMKNSRYWFLLRVNWFRSVLLFLSTRSRHSWDRQQPAGSLLRSLKGILRRLKELRTPSSFNHHELDIRERSKVLELMNRLKPDAIVHAAAQPSHDKAASIPFDDF